MRLQTKIISITFGILAISLIFLGLILFSNFNQSIEFKISQNLESSSKLFEENIDVFLNSQKSKIEIIATQSELSNEELSEMIKFDPSFYELFVLDSSGKIIASSEKTRVGMDKSTDLYFLNARNKTYLKKPYYSETSKRYSMTFSTPFNEGVLVGRVDLGYFNSLTTIRTGLGETGEHLLAFFNENGEIVYFTKRLRSSKDLEIISVDDRVKLLPIYGALSGKEGIVSNQKDYSGEETIAFMNYIEEIDLGLVTKIDEKEAFKEVYSLQILFLFAFLIILFLMAFFIYFLVRGISKEIDNLTRDIELITKGNLDIQLKESSTFEIQRLTDSLNRILASMKLAILRVGISKGELGIGELEKKKEEAEIKYKLIYETSADAIMTLEPPIWKFTSGNPAAIKMFNCKDEEEFASLSPGDLSPEKQSDGQLSSIKSKKMIEKAMKEGSAFFEWTHKRYKGEDFAASVLLSKIKEGNKEYLQATVRDVSEEKMVEEELNKLRGSAKIRDLLGERKKEKIGPKIKRYFLKGGGNKKLK